MMSPEARDLAERYVPLARKLAEQIAWGHLRYLRDEIESAAMLGLCYAARKYDPAIGPFPAYLRSRIKGAVRDELRKAGMLGLRRQEDRARTGAASPEVQLLTENNQPVIESRPVGWEIESIDEVERWVRPLEPLAKRAMTVLYTCADGVAAEAARMIGVCPSRVCHLKRQALDELRVRAGVVVIDHESDWRATA